MLGYEAVAQALVDQDIDTVFAVLGDGNLFIGDALVRNHDVRLVSATHEANAVCMAEGWAKTTGRLGVVTTTHGPGLTNTVTALVEAVRNRTPLLYVLGDTQTDDAGHIQKIDQAAVVGAAGAGFEQVRTVETIADDVATAVRRAHAERRPIALNLPYELEWEEVDYESAPAIARPAMALAPDEAGLDTAMGIVASAARPLILAGRGAARSGARDALVELGDRLGAPLATSLLGSSLFAGEPANIGVFGTLAHPVAAEVISAADCVIVFGAGLNYFTTDQTLLLDGKRVVHCDIEASAIERHVPVDAAVVGDARQVAQTMVAMLDAAEHQPSAFRSDEMVAQLAAFDPSTTYADLSRDDAVDPRTLVLRLHDMLPADRTLAVDAGRFMIDALTLPVPEPQALVTSHGFGSIGLGMSTAIGAAVGRPDRPTVLCIGDGGFMMGGLAELHTAVHLGLDLIVVLFNDGSYGAEHIQLFRLDMDPATSLHEWPDLTAVAQSLGCAATRVDNLEDLKAAGDLIDGRSGSQPVFIEVTIDPAMVSGLGYPRS